MVIHLLPANNIQRSLQEGWLKIAKAAFLLLCGLFLTGSDALAQRADDKLRTRAGFIGFEDMGLKKRDFSKLDMSHIAVLHLTDSSFGYYKIALTVFGNDQASYPMPSDFNRYTDSLIKSRFESLTMTRFTVISEYPAPEQYPFLKAKGFKTVVPEEAKEYFEMLHQQGFDGLLVLTEKHPTSNLIPAHSQYGPLSPKGIYQYMGHQYMYHSLSVGLYDLRNGTQVKDQGYLQFSADEYPSKEKPTPPLTPYMDMMKERFRNNVEQIISIHKMH